MTFGAANGASHVSARIIQRLKEAGAWDTATARAAEALWFHGVARIADERVRHVVTGLFEERVPWQFFVAPSSASRKHHPSWQNARCGLVRHVTEMAIGISRIAQAYPELTDAHATPTPEAIDILLTSVLLHDAFKGGVPWEDRTVPDHHALAAAAWREAAAQAWLPPLIIENVATAVRWHAGRWTPGWDGTLETLGARTNLYAAVLHHCDMVYSDTNLTLLFTPKAIPLQAIREQ